MTHRVHLLLSIVALFQVHIITGEDRLILTHFIKTGQLSDARELARVRHPKIESYSGFLTVNQTYDSNLFFWYFPTSLKQKRGTRTQGAPLILWLQGGPGTSSLFGLFVENGPFKISKKIKLGLRAHSWTSTHSMLYIDNPVGAGFSFTQDERGMATTEEDVTHNLFAALIQFFTLFPEVSNTDFYITGESYAGKYIPMLSMRIHKENQYKRPVYINLKGIAIGAGFCDPISMIAGYADYLYFTGLIGPKAREHFKRQGELTQNLIRNGSYDSAYHIQDELFGGDFLDYPTYFYNTTGFENYHNLLHEFSPPEPDYYDEFIQLQRTRRLIHVGNATFDRQSELVASKLKPEIFKSVKPAVEDLLRLGYSVLLYVGQLDIVVPHVAVTNFISQLKWAGRNGFDSSERRILRNDDDIMGYLQQFENLNFVLVRNAGHHVPFDQPKWALDLITRFTRGTLH